MMILLPALSGALIAGGLLGIWWSLQPQPDRPAPRRRASRLAARLTAVSPRTRLLLAGGAAVGLVVGLWTGWLIAVVLIPAAVVGLPWLLSAPGSVEQIDRLEAMAEWTRSLSGVLTVGVGLEQALIATLRSAPEPIRPEITGLVARLRARWAAEDALRAFADDLDDATGDLVAAYLILGSRRRGAGLASVLDGLAESVAADVAARRQIEADRAKPRGTARLVTLLTVGALVVLALSGSALAPYATPLGQVILSLLLSLYVATLVWMRSMARGTRLPRFLGDSPEFMRTGTASLGKVGS
ncbi:MAG: type II secretion system F family protein [Propionibacteriaceae bacterium]|nr:type II secretion system F family protein [Propionibacteriaceae bacterium]